MAREVPNPPPGFDELTVEQKLDYVQSLWDRIAARPEMVDVIAILHHHRNPNTWEQRIVE
jgi:hypothetical protein